MKIQHIVGRTIFNSHGMPTLEVDVTLESGATGRASVPSGTTKTTREAKQLLAQKNVSGQQLFDLSDAINLLNDTVTPALKGKESWDQFALDRLLCEIDGTENKSKLGANTIIATSIAIAKAHAAYKNVPLHTQIAAIAGNQLQAIPTPLITIFDGSRHARNHSDFQEVMLVPLHNISPRDAIEKAAAIRLTLKDILQQRNLELTIGDEGGFAPGLTRNAQALELALEVLKLTGNESSLDAGFAIDMAATELYHDNAYNLTLDNRKLSSAELVEWYDSLCDEYPITMIEDPIDDQDWTGWRQAKQVLQGKAIIAADSLTASKTDLIDAAISNGLADAIVIKPVQVGTLTEVIRAVQLAKNAGLKVIASHRSRETEDIALTHIAVGLSCDYIKAGALERGERVMKYNELLRIAEYL